MAWGAYESIIVLTNRSYLAHPNVTRIPKTSMRRQNPQLLRFCDGSPLPAAVPVAILTAVSFGGSGIDRSVIHWKIDKNKTSR
ncbi:hypothetical protein [Microbulbifer sediminum]|uniref:hypothetical protein n=1 Tax=Microbulbifer sediminum TaxID=2904250 RepID=UPI001F239142|nr:hypothetical protein [Microbulbifer sediminum]